MKNIAGFILLFSLLACCEEGEEGFKAGADMIAFTRDGKIHFMNSDGSDVRPLHEKQGSNRAYAYDLAWSPDGEMLAYTAGEWERFYVVNIHSLKVTEVIGTDSPTHPSWSPDGNYLAFTNYNFPSYCIKEIHGCFNITRVFVVRLNDFDIAPTNLVVDSLSMTQIVDMYPDWSPDGKKIVFCSNRATVKYQRWDEPEPEGDSKLEIYVMNPDGTDVRQLTDLSFQVINPVWSPDGTKIAFTGYGDGNNSWSVYTMNADGSGLFQVTHNLGRSDRGLAWSPDGTALAFASDHDGNSEIYTINIDGTGLKRLTNDPRADEDPVWSPISLAD